jgi:hypothetical protein
MAEVPHGEEEERDSGDELSMTTMVHIDASEQLDQEDWQEPDDWCEDEEPYEEYTLDEGYITLLLEEDEGVSS